MGDVTNSNFGYSWSLLKGRCDGDEGAGLAASFSTLCTRQTNPRSLLTLSTPRSRNCRKRRPLLDMPEHRQWQLPAEAVGALVDTGLDARAAAAFALGGKLGAPRTKSQKTV